MPADISDLKRIYRRLARSKAEAPHGLSEQITWLTTTFLGHAERTNADTMRVTTLSQEGGSSSFAFPDSTPQERAVALDQLLTELEAERDGTVNPYGGSIIVPHFCAPR